MSEIPENAPPITAPPALPAIDAPTLDPVPRPAWGEEDTPPDTTTQAPAQASTSDAASVMFRMRNA